MKLTYKYRLYPTNYQARQLGYALWIARSIYNDCLKIRQKRWDESRRFISWMDLRNMWIGSSGLRNEPGFEELKYLPSATIDATVRRLEKARKAFSKKYQEFITGKTPLPPPKERDAGLSFRARCRKCAGPPRFKGRKHFRSIDYVYGSGVKLIANGHGARLRVMNIGNVKVRYHRPVPDDAAIKNIVVTEDLSGRWWAALQIDLEERALPSPMYEGAVGVDVGLKYLLALSDGTTFDHPHWYGETLREKRILMRKLDRQRRANNPGCYNEDGTFKKGARLTVKSTRMKNTERLLRKVSQKAQEQRWYFWHNVTDELTRNYSYIAIEDLTLDFMQKNKHLAMNVYDAGFGMFWQMLDYKCQERAVMLVKVDPKHTSQRCPVCGCVSSDNRKTQALFQCHDCGHEENADINAARNILRRAMGNGEMRPEPVQMGFWRE